jgi:hypothetical protein
MSEADYTRLTYTLTMNTANNAVTPESQMTFVYVSGAGPDSSEKGKLMWAPVKGRSENALLRLPFKAAYMFRIGFVIPVNGERSPSRSPRCSERPSLAKS